MAAGVTRQPLDTSQRGRPVDLRLPGTQEIQIRSIQTKRIDARTRLPRSRGLALAYGTRPHTIYPGYSWWEALIGFSTFPTSGMVSIGRPTSGPGSSSDDPRGPARWRRCVPLPGPRPRPGNGCRARRNLTYGTRHRWFGKGSIYPNGPRVTPRSPFSWSSETIHQCTRRGSHSVEIRLRRAAYGRGVPLRLR